MIAASRLRDWFPLLLSNLIRPSQFVMAKCHRAASCPSFCWECWGKWWRNCSSPVNGSAFYNTYGKNMLAHDSPLQVLPYSYYAVFAFMLPATLWPEPRSFLRLPRFTPTIRLGLVILALFQYFPSMVIFLKVLTRPDATQAGLCNYLIPFFGLALAWAVLRERLTPTMIAGGALVLAGTIPIAMYQRRTARMPGGLTSSGL
jgi:hypothetical protein